MYPEPSSEALGRTRLLIVTTCLIQESSRSHRQNWGLSKSRGKTHRAHCVGIAHFMPTHQLAICRAPGSARFAQASAAVHCACTDDGAAAALESKSSTTGQTMQRSRVRALFWMDGWCTCEVQDASSKPYSQAGQAKICKGVECAVYFGWMSV